MPLWKLLGILTIAACDLAHAQRAPTVLVLYLAGTEAGREVECASQVVNSKLLQLRAVSSPGHAASEAQQSLGKDNLLAVVGPVGLGQDGDAAVNEMLSKAGAKTAQISVSLEPLAVDRKRPQYLHTGPTAARLRFAAERFLLSTKKPAAIGVFGLPPDEAFQGAGDGTEYYAKLWRGSKVGAFAFYQPSRDPLKDVDLLKFAKEPRNAIVLLRTEIQAARVLAAGSKETSIAMVASRALNTELDNLFVAAPVDPRKVGTAQKFVEDYLAKCPNESMAGFAMASYIAMSTASMAVTAASRQSSPGAEDVLNELRKGKFATPMGDGLSYEGEDGVMRYPDAAIWGRIPGQGFEQIADADTTPEPCMGQVCTTCSACRLNGKCEGSLMCRRPR